MTGIIMLLIAIIVLGGAYLIYGKYLCKTWGIDENAKTPAYEYEDGVDYVPADTQMVFGHQFASIAGAGPISGPILAAVFGWVPVLLWILIGGIFFGAVQDFVSMYASVKNKGRTIGYIIEEYIGKSGKFLFLIFCWLFCILVIAAFADVVANTFVSNSDVVATNLANGSVATTSSLFILEAVGLGFILRYGKLNKLVNTILAILLLVVGISVGLSAPILGVSVHTWHVIVFLYIMIASVVPVWSLLQPRDYLNSYLLIFMIAAAVLGIVVANPSINMNAFNGFYVEGMGYLFPILFVTIACGAVSGFHSLISSGTSSKQIKNEKSMLPVSFGSMLLESLLAVVSLIVVGSFVGGTTGAAELGYTTPSLVFAGGIAGFLETIGLPHTVVFTLINLAVSAFALTSLDSVARIGRLSFQELFLNADIDDESMKPWRKVVTNKYFATAITLLFAYALAKMGYSNIWPLFGSANQLLSALALIACAVFLKKTNRNGKMIWAPMTIMLCVTLSALTITIYSKVASLVARTSTSIPGDLLQLSFAIVLFILGIIVAGKGFKRLMEKDTQPQSA
ncbi:MAG: carbon starvation protein A [Eubacteriales bacterium]